LIDRRALLKQSSALVAALGTASVFDPLRAFAADMVTLPFGNGERPMVKYPQKRPMIGMTSRPPQLETPFAVFNDGVITPNDAFFVRYHLAGIPLEIDPDTFRVEVKGKVDKPLKLSLAELKAMPSVEIVAVNQCSGNSRGFSNPRVAGGQLGNGAMGNARWRGVPLKALLDRAGVQPGARQVTFKGMDGPVMDKTPDFVKALDIDHARDGEVMIAYAMNGEQLPLLNGFPLRLVVPGWYSTYWVKMLDRIEVLDGPDDSFWMKSAYLIPDTPGATMKPGQTGVNMVPINKMVPRSFVTNLKDGDTLKAGAKTLVRGIAFGGSTGVKSVGISIDGGASWLPTVLGRDEGKYSFRQWQREIVPAAGAVSVMVRCTNNDGLAQPATLNWNAGGFMHNAIEIVHVTAS
jgi:sulfite dehydrogenase